MRRALFMTVAASLVALPCAAQYQGGTIYRTSSNMVFQQGTALTMADGVTFTLGANRILGANSESILLGVPDNVFTFAVDGTNTVVITGADATGPADTVYDTAGAGSITIGSADVGGITLTAAGSIRTNAVGAVAGTGNSAVERCIGYICQTTLTLSGVVVTITDPGSAAGYGSVKLYDFPEGYIYSLGVVADLKITAGTGGIADNFDGDVALGSAADAGGGLGGAEVNWVPSTATPQATAGVTTADCVSTTTEVGIKDGHATASSLYLTFNVDNDDISSSDTLSVTGTIVVTWIRLGDN